MRADRTGVVHLAANNGDLGGGEVMLVAAARALRDLGVGVHVVGPHADGGVVEAAGAQGFATTALPQDRRSYARALRRWDRTRSGLLWCHGLVPALATAGRPGRLVELHQLPRTRALVAAARVARAGALATLVPSHAMAARVPGARVLWNWCDEVPTPAHPGRGSPAVVGFLGRWSEDKGVPDLIAAARIVDADRPGALTVRLAGAPLFVGDAQRQVVETAIRTAGPLVEPRGWVDRGAFFAGIDIAAFPSVWAEPFGLVVTEAMSARVPFVVSDAGALPEVAGPRHPWVARAGDPADLARALIAVIDASPSDLSRATAQAHQRWSEHFSPPAGRERVRRLLSAHGHPTASV